MTETETSRPCCELSDYAPHICLVCHYQHCHCPGGTPGPLVGTPVDLLALARERIRHDHAYPMEIFDEDHPHHCPGCDVEKAIDEVIEVATAVTRLDVIKAILATKEFTGAPDAEIVAALRYWVRTYG